MSYSSIDEQIPSGVTELWGNKAVVVRGHIRKGKMGTQISYNFVNKDEVKRHAESPADLDPIIASRMYSKENFDAIVQEHFGGKHPDYLVLWVGSGPGLAAAIRLASMMSKKTVHLLKCDCFRHSEWYDHEVESAQEEYKKAKGIKLYWHSRDCEERFFDFISRFLVNGIVPRPR